MAHTNGSRAPRDEGPRTTGGRHTAGLFDIRNVIGGLLGIYGLILLVMGLVGDPELDKTGGINANLWAGIVLVVFGAAMLLWAKLRPTYVPEGAAVEAETGEFGHP